MNETSRKNIYHAGSKLLESVAYGDAAGLPVETLSARKIRERHRAIHQLLPAMLHPHFSKETGTGIWSDDTQLSLAVAESLILADGFDVSSQAEAHIRAYKKTKQVENRHGRMVPRGWGGSTYSSVERMMQGYPPEEWGSEKGEGNGVLMKLAPLVYWQVARQTNDEQRWHEYDQLTDMTHRNSYSRLTTRIHGDVLHGLLGGVEVDMVDISARHEGRLGEGDFVTQQLEYLRSSPPGDSYDVLGNTDGEGFASSQTLAMVYGAFMLKTGDFKTDLYRAINMGGDTDSIGSILAVMLNFHHKGDIIFPSDIHDLEDRALLKKVSRKLVEQAMKGARS